MRLLGVDLTATEVRLARAERRFGVTRLVACTRATATTADARRAALAPVLAWRPHAIVAALPVAQLGHRIVTLPFRDAGRLDETVLLDLGRCPPIRDVASGHLSLGGDGGGTRARRARRHSRVDALGDALAASAPPARVDAALAGAVHLLDGAGDAALVPPMARTARSRSGATAARGPAQSRAIRPSMRARSPARCSVRSPPWGAPSWCCSAPTPLGIVVARPGDAHARRPPRRRRRPGLARARRRHVRRRGGPRRRSRADAPSCRGARRQRAARGGPRRRRRALRARGLRARPLAARAARRALAEAVRATARRRCAGTRVVALRAARARPRPSRAGPATVAFSRCPRAWHVSRPTRLGVDELAVEGDVLRLRGRTDRFESIDAVTRARDLGVAARRRRGGLRAAVDGNGVEFRVRATWRPALGAPS
jgi:hypothetical protein